MTKTNIQKIVEYQNKLGISKEEAIQLLEDDKKIDKGEKLFELDPESEKGAKKARLTPHKVSKKSTPREKKINNEKIEICETLIQSLKLLGVEDIEIINNEREFSFSKNNTKYKITLSCPRK